MHACGIRVSREPSLQRPCLPGWLNPPLRSLHRPIAMQLEGGRHRYLDAYPEDGGFWVSRCLVGIEAKL